MVDEEPSCFISGRQCSPDMKEKYFLKNNLPSLVYCIDQQPVLSSRWVKGSGVKIFSFFSNDVRLSISRINFALIFFIVDKVQRLFGGVSPA